MARFASSDDLARWDELVLANPDGGNILQTKAYAQFKAGQGWTPRFVIHTLDGAEMATLYLVRSVPLLGEVWYAPKGPGVKNVDQLATVLNQTRELAPNVSLLIKVEPELADNANNRQGLAAAGLVKSTLDLNQNRFTAIVDLRPSEAEILAGLKPKTRYNIRVAERHGVVVRPVPPSAANLEQMYELMSAAQSRGGFALRSQAYFERFWNTFSQAGQGQLFLAEQEGRVLAGAYVLKFGSKGLYKDGGSVRDRPELMAPYRLQWEIMRWLKARGVGEYDLHGTPPTNRVQDRSHPLFGLAQFKLGFQPQVTEYVGVWDWPLRAQEYRIWRRVGEHAMMVYSHRIKQELWY